MVNGRAKPPGATREPGVMRDAWCVTGLSSQAQATPMPGNWVRTRDRPGKRLEARGRSWPSGLLQSPAAALKSECRNPILA
jgi:hypothetical protein